MLNIKPCQGMSNNIKSLINGIELAKHSRHSVQLDEYFKKFFYVNQDWQISNTELSKNVSTWKLDFPSSYNQQECLHTPSCFLTFDNAGVVKTHGIDFQYFNIKDNIRTHYINLIKNNIKLHDNIQTIIENESALLDCRNKIGIHIRTWNGVGVRKAICFDERTWFDLLHKYHNESPFVCCDDKALLDRIKTKFSNVTCFTNFTEDKQLNDFIELMLLSRCKKIIGSYESTFTEVAWWFSECKPIEIVETKAVQILNDFYKKLI
jgi:hypothetical protein